MSQPSSRQRKPKVKTEDEIVSQIIRLQKSLANDHKSASLFTYSSKFGQLEFGSDNAVKKFQSEYRKDGDWPKAFTDDDEELISGDQNVDLDDLSNARASILPRKRPASVGLMNYTELWKWISEEILKEYWARGGKSKCVKYGRADFEPSFWLPEIWGWENVDKHPRDLSKNSFTGPGNMTEFLKKL